MRITSGFMTNLSGDNIDSSTGSGIEGRGSREQIWRFGAREEAFRALRAPLYATRGVASEECECRKIGSPTEGAAGQPKERRGDPQRGLRPKKGVRCFGAEVIIQ